MLRARPLAPRLSIYSRHGELQKHNDYSCDAEELDEASVFVHSVLHDPRVPLPRAAVIDVGRIAGRGWAIVEQNGAWGSGLYGCDPEQVLHVLRHAAEKRQT